MAATRSPSPRISFNNARSTHGREKQNNSATRTSNDYCVREPIMDPLLDVCAREPIMVPLLDVCARETPLLDVCAREPIMDPMLSSLGGSIGC